MSEQLSPDPYENERFSNQCPTCGQPFLREKVDQLIAQNKHDDDADTECRRLLMEENNDLRKERDEYLKFISFVANRPLSGSLTLPIAILADTVLKKFGR